MSIVDKVSVRAATADDLDALRALPFSGGMKEKHFDRLARQVAGDVVYLLAVIDDQVVGHLLLKWDHPTQGDIRAKTGPVAEIEDFTVSPDLRDMGIGSRLLEESARLAVAHGWNALGLGVGHENTHARGMYERRGFVPVADSEHRATWTYLDKAGHTCIDYEDCTYLVKELS
jgi:ribosomal protein S18 acetylase RimI-like enzyme